MAKKISPEEIAQLKTANPPPRGSKREHGIILLSAGPDDADVVDCDDFVFKVPPRATWVQYRGHVKASLAGRGPADAATILAKNCLLWPTAAEFDALRERAAPITEEFGEILASAADDGMSVREGKL